MGDKTTFSFCSPVPRPPPILSHQKLSPPPPLRAPPPPFLLPSASRPRALHRGGHLEKQFSQSPMRALWPFVQRGFRHFQRSFEGPTHTPYSSSVYNVKE